MRLRILFTAAVAFAIALAPPPAAAATQYSAAIDGAQVPTPSPGTGTGLFTLNDPGTQLSINVSFSGLIAPQTAAHIHGPAAPGANAGVRFGFPLGSPVITVWNILAADVVSLNAGLLYVNVHSQTYPGGEIRGQILAAVPTLPKSWGKVKAIYASGER